MSKIFNNKFIFALLCIVLATACVLATGVAVSHAEEDIAATPTPKSGKSSSIFDQIKEVAMTGGEDKNEVEEKKDDPVLLTLTKGFLRTLELFFFTLLGAIPLGLIICFGSMSKIPVIKYPIRAIIWVIRGTPLMLQLIIIFYGPGLMFGNNFWNGLSNGRIIAAIVAFVINYACYFSEIYRGGIESISKGQYEAGAVLGMTKSQTFFKVVVVQVIKRILPSMSNEIITLVKDTSLARIIAVYEIIYEGQSFIKSDGIIWPLFATGVYYLLFSGLLTLVLGRIEKKLSHIT